MKFLSSALSSQLLFTVALAVSTITITDHAVAQSRSVIATIPFAFQEGSHTFSPGEYQIRYESNILSVRSMGGEDVGIHMTLAELRTRSTEAGKLIFNKYGERYFLSDIWFAGSQSGRKLVASRQEKQLRGTPTSQSGPGNQVALNLQP